MQAAWSRSDPSRGTLNPNFQYLRVVTGGRVVVLALGDIDGPEQDPIEVWYSAEKEVLRIQRGRIVGAVGLTKEWRTVSLPELPSWNVLANSDGYRWTRLRDVMPGYKFGVRDNLLTTKVSPPSRSTLQGVSASELTWFEEITLSSDIVDKLPPARYALQYSDGSETIVYGEQCLDADFCFSWQRWSASKQPARP